MDATPIGGGYVATVCIVAFLFSGIHHLHPAAGQRVAPTHPWMDGICSAGAKL